MEKEFEEEMMKRVKSIFTSHFKTQEVSLSLVFDKKKEFRYVAKLTRKNEIKIAEGETPWLALFFLERLLSGKKI